MSVLIPFLLGTIVGGAFTWQVDRRRQQGKNGPFFKEWFSDKKDQTRRSPEPQQVRTDAAEAAPSAPEVVYAGAQPSSQTPDGV